MSKLSNHTHLITYTVEPLFNDLRVDPLQLPCHFHKTLRYLIQVCILTAILEYMGIGKMH